MLPASLYAGMTMDSFMLKAESSDSGIRMKLMAADQHRWMQMVFEKNAEICVHLR